jgi:hypothetical protein
MTQKEFVLKCAFDALPGWDLLHTPILLFIGLVEHLADYGSGRKLQGS